MDEFFLSNEHALVDPDAPIPKRKRERMLEAAKAYIASQKKNQKGSTEVDDDDIASSESDNEPNLKRSLESDLEDEGSEVEKETPAQKRLRLAKQYLSKLKDELAQDENEEDADAAQIDRDLIADRLRDDALEAAGKLFHAIADKFAELDLSKFQVRTFKGGKNSHQLTLTSVTVAIPEPDDQTAILQSRQPVYIYTSSKDASIVKWDFYSGRKMKFMPGGLKPTKKAKAMVGEKKLKEHQGHNDHILSIAASSNGKYLATGGKDKIVHIWSIKTGQLLGSLKQHRDTVSALAFRKGSNDLYTASLDRSVKVWNVEEMSYIETLFGHQDHITSIDTLSKERCVTAGSRDRTMRLWKIPEESQLVFRGGSHGLNASEELVVMDGLAKKKTDKNQAQAGGSLDVVAMVEEDLFLSGSDSGAISLWNVTRKKPIFTKFKAHGESMNGSCNWITSLAAVPHSDLFASGSCDGFIRFWKISPTKRSFAPIFTIPMEGFVNSMSFFEAASSESLTQQKNEKQTLEGLSRTEKILKLEHYKLKRKNVENHLHLAVALGQEHRLGRWWRMKSVKNQLKVISLGPSK